MKIGIDVGGTKTEGILLDPNGTEIDRKRINTEKSYDGTIKGILSIINHFEDKHGKAESVGMGMPGAISNDTALIKNANSIWLNGKPFKQDLDKILNRNINIENDANCFTLSEAVDGAGKGYQVVFGVIIGTGVGGGISIDQKVIRGRNSISGEWGHIVLPGRTEEEKKYVKKCYCGKNGCLETYISGPGFSSAYNLRFNKNYNSHQILEGFINNEENSIFALNQYIDHLARGLSVVCNILDPDVIVLGGGMSNIDFIYENINDTLKKYVFTDTLETKVVKNVYGDSSGVRGAAWLS